MPRSSSGAAGRGTKRQRTSGPAATRDDDDPEADLPTSPASPTSHIDPAIDSLLQHSAASIDPPSPPASSLSSHYFDAHIGSGKPGSRRRTQRSLLAVRQEALQAGLDASIPLLCQDANERSDRLLAEHRQLFPAWHMRLKHGMSVLLYGFGSKKRLLTSFAREWLTDGSVIVINGYNAAFTAKHLLNAITQQILLSTTTQRDLPSHLAHITQFFTSPAASAIPHVYLVVHSIDGPAMRSVVVQSLLAELLTLDAFHLIASADHASTPLLFPPASLSAFQFVMWRCDTWLGYGVEVAGAGVGLGEEVGGGGGGGGGGGMGAVGGVRGVGDVVSSLTPSHRELLAVLGEMWMTRVEEREKEKSRRDEVRKDKQRKEAAARSKARGSKTKKSRTVDDIEQQQRADIAKDSDDDDDGEDDVQLDGDAAEAVEEGGVGTVAGLTAALRSKVSLPLSDIVNRANEAMLGRGEANIRALMRELLDHQLVVPVTRNSKAGAGGAQQQYVVPHSNDVIRQHYTRTARPASSTAAASTIAASGKEEVQESKQDVAAPLIVAELDFPEENERKRGRGRSRKSAVSDEDEDGDFLL